MAKQQYCDKDIQSISGLDWVKLRPETSIGSMDQYGLFVLFREAFENAMDEVEQVMSPGNKVDIYLFLDYNNLNLQIAVKDNGRGIPHGKLVSSCTQMFTSGKYIRGENAVFSGTSGLNGMGLKSIYGLSSVARSIVNRDHKLSSVCLRNGNLDTLIHEKNIPTDQSFDTGTFIIFEPDKTIFSEIDKFIESGYDKIIKLCYLISMFSKKANITVNIISGSINEEFWNLPADQAFNYIEKNYTDKLNTVVDSSNKEVNLDYLKELWNVPVNEDFQWELTNIQHPLEDKIGYNISIYLPKTLRGTNAISIVNNVPINDTTSSHMSALITTLKNKLVQYIENKDYKEYFLSIYKLPICCTAVIKYTDIKFTGLSKSGFRDLSFEHNFSNMLKDEFDAILDFEWETLYNLISKDIELKYNIYYNKPVSRKNNKSSLDILKPIYKDCKTSNRQEAELYIIEGKSANHIVNARDPETQAVMMIYGKPKNTFKTGNTNTTPLQLFQSYPIYQELEKILDIHPKQMDLSTANFGKIILMNDADIDGGHIQALHIGGLYNLNPRIITSGMVYLANPPLYQITVDDKTKKYRFIQDKRSLIKFFIDCMYRNTFDIAIMDGKVFKEPVSLDDESFTDFCFIITEIGELFYNLSNKLAIPTVILEKLTYLTQYMQPGRVNGAKLAEYIGKGCSYNPHTDILTVITDKMDYSFSIEGITDALYEELLGYLRALCWKDLQIYVTTRYTDTLKNTRVSITQLYEMFLSLTRTLEITRQKGLGGINSNDLRPLCMNKATRVLHRITSLGDYERIRNLLGDDVAERKAILKEHGLDVN